MTARHSLCLARELVSASVKRFLWDPLVHSFCSRAVHSGKGLVSTKKALACKVIPTRHPQYAKHV